MTDLPPFLYRLYRQNLRRNTIVKEYRQMHKLERMLFALPAKAYVRWQHVKNRLRAKQTEPPKGGFFVSKTMEEENAGTEKHVQGGRM